MAGEEGGLAPKERCLSLSRAPDGGWRGRPRCACVCVEQKWTVAETLEEEEVEAETEAE